MIGENRMHFEHGEQESLGLLPSRPATSGPATTKRFLIIMCLLLVYLSWNVMQPSSVQKLNEFSSSSATGSKSKRLSTLLTPMTNSHLASEPKPVNAKSGGIFSFERLTEAVLAFENSAADHPISFSTPNPTKATPVNPTPAVQPVELKKSEPLTPVSPTPEPKPTPQPSNVVPPTPSTVQPIPVTDPPKSVPNLQNISFINTSSSNEPLFYDMGKYFPHGSALPYEYFDWADKITEKTYPTGMRWVHINDEGLDVVESAIAVQAGSFDETRGKFPEGTAHLLEHSVFLPRKVSEEPLFSSTNAVTDPQLTSYYNQATAANFPKAFRVATRDLFKFTVLPDQIMNEVKAVDSE